MEQNVPIAAKRIWSVIRVVYFMLRKGITTKRKLMVDLNMFFKRGKIAGAKVIGNLMFHHHNNHCHHNNNNSRHVAPFVPGPNEYEFSCSNTPNYIFPGFHGSKKKNNHHHLFFPCTHAPATHEIDDMTAATAVKAVLDILNNDNNINGNKNNNDQMAAVVQAAVQEITASPLLPGFGRSPFVRQLRITDSPFPLKDVDEDNGYVDKAAEEFIKKFYKDLNRQKRMADN